MSIDDKVAELERQLAKLREKVELLEQQKRDAERRDNIVPFQKRKKVGETDRDGSS